MNSGRRTAIIVGMLFLTAIITSLLGGGILESIINEPDYLINASINTTVIILGVCLELINSIAVIGIAVLLFPILKQEHEGLSLGYVGFRILESAFCIVCAIIPLSWIWLSQEYLKAEPSNSDYFLTLGSFLTIIRSGLMDNLIPLFFGLGALAFYYLLYKSKLIPRFISVWGFVGVILILALILFEAGMIINIIFVLPIILNELFLGTWLIVKGFNISSVKSKPVLQFWS